MTHQGSALDHNLLNHAGPTDHDVAMFHRDAGPGKAQIQETCIQRTIEEPPGPKEETPNQQKAFDVCSVSYLAACLDIDSTYKVCNISLTLALR